ncbi:MAG: protein phosphatase 2C domain-containing protein [Pirellulaceae bacterium]
MKRSNNQDSFAVDLAGDAEAWQERGHLFLVADGMGAHAAGELASRLAAEKIPQLYRKYRDVSPPEALQKAVIETNSEVNRRGEANADFHHMGTTCSVLTMLPQGAVLAHIGDSRIYRLRGGQLEQLTFDHSLVWEMRAAGQLPEGSQLANSVPKNVITRSLGPNANVKVDLEGPFPLEVGDTFLLCSDGLSGQIDDEEMAPLLATLTPQEAVRVLVDLGNLRGGPDNITVIIARVVGPGITTAMAGGEPITIGAKKVDRSVHPVLWGVMGACFLAALGMAALQQWILGLVFGVVGLGTLGYILYLLKSSPTRGGVVLPVGKHLGKGPYTQTSCQATPEFVETLAGVVEHLRKSARDAGWEINWSLADKHVEAAEVAAKSAKYAEAVRAYANTISFMMDEVRSLRQQRKASDSSIEL